MSRFFTEKYSNLEPYVPGEQPRDRRYVKLNTNESPFSPPKLVAKAVKEEANNVQLYSDPECVNLRESLAGYYKVSPDKVIMTNGSDEGINFAFMAFADDKSPLAFPDITYGFYPVFARLNHIPYTEIPLTNDFSINVNDYIGINKTIVIANPNAPTGKFMPLENIRRILESNPDNVVIVDEAYVDFGGESAIRMTDEFSNLLVIGTFSKSRSMAGVRLGFCIGNPELIADINTIKYSTNPYNVSKLASAAGVAAIAEQSYFDDKCRTIIKNREWTVKKLEKLGFTVIVSTANFVFAKSDRIDGGELYLKLKEKGVLIRHFTKERIKDYNRITIGTKQQMRILIDKIKEVLEEKA